jgi:G:T-mismatch repair DNA endonuclease (very short patch repair protein)
MPKKLTREQFIADATEVHGGKYDYSRVQYKNAKSKIEIGCPEHGWFFQTADLHRRGKGCLACRPNRAGESQKRTMRETLIDRFRAVHGNRYDYSKVKYVDATTPVTILCPEHGEFLQTPNSHKRGSGCLKCAYTKNGADKAALVKAELHQRFRDVHGDRYDYSRVEYVGRSTKVTIGCQEHGWFQQTPSSHWEGHGCPKCADIERGLAKRAAARANILKKFHAMHADKYDYSEFVYTRSDEKATIVCRVHGPFLQTPRMHARGNGCPACAKDSVSSYIRLGDAAWLMRFREVHGNRYDYSEALGIRTTENTSIICRVHGPFTQRPQAHAKGAGCPRCCASFPDTQESVIAKFVLTHGARYDYSKVKYVDSQSKVTITCPEHGEFEQKPANHIKGKGCRHCARLLLRSSRSEAETNIDEFAKELGFDTEHGYLPGAKDWTYDVVVPEVSLAIEFNGLYWHSYPRINRGRHYHKRKHAESHGFRLLTIWEDDWNDRREAVQWALLRALKVGWDVKCAPQDVETDFVDEGMSNDFRVKNGMVDPSGSVAATNVAINRNGNTLAVANFDKRGCMFAYTEKAGFTVMCGPRVAAEAYKAANPGSNVSALCNRDYSDGREYADSGFIKTGGYFGMSYVYRSNRFPRANYLKHRLPKVFGDVDRALSEVDICANNEVFACWNSGIDTYELKNL